MAVFADGLGIEGRGMEVAVFTDGRGMEVAVLTEGRGIEGRGIEVAVFTDGLGREGAAGGGVTVAGLGGAAGAAGAAGTAFSFSILSSDDHFPPVSDSRPPDPPCNEN